jgi:hypothetical protein
MGIEAYLDWIRADFDDLLANGRVRRAGALCKESGIPFADSGFQYFTGDLDACIVLVHLNPKWAPEFDLRQYRDFEDWIDHHRRFGHYHWGNDPSYRSRFDMKQVRFLRPFGVIDFLPPGDRRNDRRNAELAVDQKLQLELIPYASNSFPTNRLTGALLQPYFDLLLGVVTARPRDYVIFCGVVFEHLLRSSGRLVEFHEHRFRLPTTKGTSRNEYCFANVVIDAGGSPIKAAVARSFAIQGLPMDAYGHMCSRLYHHGAAGPDEMLSERP